MAWPVIAPTNHFSTTTYHTLARANNLAQQFGFFNRLAIPPSSQEKINAFNSEVQINCHAFLVYCLNAQCPINDDKAIDSRFLASLWLMVTALTFHNHRGGSYYIGQGEMYPWLQLCPNSSIDIQYHLYCHLDNWFGLISLSMKKKKTGKEKNLTLD